MIKPEFDVIVCGSLHLDVMVGAPHLPQLDETVPGSKWSMVCGGKGGNQAVMARRLGSKTAMIGQVGDDDFGKKLLANLKTENVDIRCISTGPISGSGMSVAILDRNGDYGAVIVSGVNLALDEAVCAQKFLELGNAKILILQNEIPEAVNISVERRAKKSGAMVFHNAAPARGMSDEFIDLIDVLVVNRVEAQMLSGDAVTDAASAATALAYYKRENLSIIVTFGGNGLVVRTKDNTTTILAPCKVKVVSTYGAGDCCIGVLTSRLEAGDQFLTAATYANHAAARHVALELASRAKYTVENMQK